MLNNKIMIQLRDYNTGEQIKDSWYFENELDQIPLIIGSTITLDFFVETRRVKTGLKGTYVIRHIHTRCVAFQDTGRDYSKFKTNVFVQEINPTNNKRLREANK